MREYTYALLERDKKYEICSEKMLRFPELAEIAVLYWFSVVNGNIEFCFDEKYEGKYDLF